MDSEDVNNHKEFNICFSIKLYIIRNPPLILLLLIVSCKSVQEITMAIEVREARLTAGFPR